MYINKGICEVIEDNKMGFSQYVIKNRALPNVYSGMKPIHEKIIWSMFFNKTFDFTKSLSVAGDAMKYTPHGSPYETMVYMAQEDRHIYNLLIGHGNFGSATSTKIQYGADRYTEVKLSELAIDCLEGIKHDMVDMINNYDNSRKLPKHIPTKYPLILTMASSGMAEGMANNSPSFNLEEVCNATILALQDKEIPMLIPDFATNGFIINDKHIIEQINKKGTGAVVLRSKWHSDGNDIIITEIPYGVKVSVESIMNKIIELYKKGKLKEINDVKDLTDKDGLRIKILCKKNTNHEKLMNNLFKVTQLESNFSCNMNVLVKKEPKVLGVHDTIKEWIKFRRDCILRGLSYDIKIKELEYNKLLALKSILLDIDKSIDIIRHTDNPQDELMKYFKIDDIQSEFILSKPLRQINEKDILKQLKDIDDKKSELDILKETVKSQVKMDEIIINDLKETVKKFKQPRRTIIIETSEIIQIPQEEFIEEYNCRIFYTNKYIKKHLKQSDNHKVVEGNTILGDFTTTNKSTLLIFTNKERRYRIQCSDLEQYQPSTHGTFVPKLLGFEDDEEIIKTVSIEKPTGFILVAYDDGNLAKIKIDKYMSSYKKLEKCYSSKSKVLDIYYSEKDVDILMVSDEGKGIIFNSSNFNAVGSTNSQGNVGMKLNEDGKVISVIIDINKEFKFELETFKGKNKSFMLSDVAPTNKTNEERTLYDYLYSKRGNQGNFLINTRSTQDEVISLITNKQ